MWMKKNCWNEPDSVLVRWLQFSIQGPFQGRVDTVSVKVLLCVGGLPQERRYSPTSRIYRAYL